MKRERSYYAPVVVAILLGLLLAAAGPTAAMASDTYSVAVDEHEVQNGDDDSDGPEDSPFCEEGNELEHPIAAAIADSYDGVEYDDVIGWYCDGFGFGQILLALHTADVTERTDDDVEFYLGLRSGDDDAEPLGWGQIWQAEGLIGRPADAGPPTDAGPPFGDPPEGNGPPEGVPPGPPEGVPPGPPDGVDPPGPPEEGEEPGPPEGVPPGPPDGVDPPGPPEEGEEPGPPEGVPPGPPDGIDPPGPPEEGEESGPPEGVPPGPPNGGGGD